MRRWKVSLLILGQASLVLGLAVSVRSGVIPLGVPGDWEWLRVRLRPDPLLFGLAVAAILLYVGFAAAGARSLARGHGAVGWLVALVPIAVVTQAAVQEGAPAGHGLAKWAIALHSSGSSGYYSVAKSQIRDLQAFLADYPDWIGHQDALHVGTHPPGLFLVAWGTLRAMESNPPLARAVASGFPTSLDQAFQSLAPRLPLPLADRAALAITGFATLCACSATVVPLYLLARSRLSATASWSAATLWPLVPAALLFQPTADTAFPLLSTSALALAGWSDRRPALAVLAGLVMAAGAQFSLVFFPIGLIAALVYSTMTEAMPRRRLALIGLTGAGFLGLTFAVWAFSGANPFSIWRTNALNHARFYVQFPRRYWAWVAENPVELVVAIGLPTVAWAGCGLRSAPKVVAATLATLVGLTLSAKNLSEVGRLWLPMMPPLLVAAGAGMVRLDARAIGLAATLFLLGLQTLILQTTIQVVYPFTVLP